MAGWRRRRRPATAVITRCISAKYSTVPFYPARTLLSQEDMHTQFTTCWWWSHLECQWLWSEKEMDFTCHRCDFGGNWGQIIMHRNGDRKRHRALLLLVLPSQQWHLPEHQKPYHQQRQIHDIVGDEERGIMVMKVNKFCLLLCRSYIFICTCKEWPWWVVPLLLLLLLSCSH